MFTVLRTDEFDSWLSKLRDLKGKARIIARIRSAELGNFGDTQSVGDGVREMRIHFGPGYRIYFKRAGKILIILLVGGDKSSQIPDIKKAKIVASAIKR